MSCAQREMLEQVIACLHTETTYREALQLTHGAIRQTRRYLTNLLGAWEREIKWYVSFRPAAKAAENVLYFASGQVRDSIRMHNKESCHSKSVWRSLWWWLVKLAGGRPVGGNISVAKIEYKNHRILNGWHKWVKQEDIKAIQADK